MSARLSPPTLLRIKRRPKSWGGLFFLDRHLERSRCPFLMFGLVVLGKYYFFMTQLLYMPFCATFRAVFHINCIGEWLSGYRHCCPLCLRWTLPARPRRHSWRRHRRWRHHRHRRRNTQTDRNVRQDEEAPPPQPIRRHRRPEFCMRPITVQTNHWQVRLDLSRHGICLWEAFEFIENCPRGKKTCVRRRDLKLWVSTNAEWNFYEFLVKVRLMKDGLY